MIEPPAMANKKLFDANTLLLLPFFFFFCNGLVASSLDPKRALVGWQEGANLSTPCLWRGLKCKGSVVIGIDLSGMNLSGSFPSYLLAQFPSLLSLNLSRNRLWGPLPTALPRGLVSLDISYNGFNGTLSLPFLPSLLTFSAFSNNFSGPLPLGIAHAVPSLQWLDLGGSYFVGGIPLDYGDLASLRYLDLSGNMLTGTIPSSLGNLSSLSCLKIGWNRYSGGIPASLGDLSSLELLDLAGSSLTGPIPASLGNLSRLHTLFLYKNHLSSSIPVALGELTGLLSLDLSQNLLTGRIPVELGKLQNLTLLSFMYNNLVGEIPSSIAKLSKLMTFLAWNNLLSGSLPVELGQHSPLVWLDVSANKLTGYIPSGLCSGGKLFKLMLFDNRFTGRIPEELVKCEPLWRMRIQRNQLTGPIPYGFGQLPNLTYVDFSVNRLTGGIPSDLGKASSLQFVDFSLNPLGGSIPVEIWSIKTLQKLHASQCELIGELTITNHDCPPLIALNLSSNLITGSIPPSIGLCQKLNVLDLANNRLSANIPPQLATLPVLSTLSLAHNFFNGTIPYQLQNCTALETCDLSYNNLSGQIPSQGLFRVINPTFLQGNPGLCGGVLRSCLQTPKKATRSLTWIGIACIFSLIVLMLALAVSYFYKQYKHYLCNNCQHKGGEASWKLIAFQRLNFTVEDILKCLTSSNIIGMGAAGTVYRAEMQNGELIAVKKLWTSQKENDLSSRSNSTNSRSKEKDLSSRSNSSSSSSSSRSKEKDSCSRSNSSTSMSKEKDSCSRSNSCSSSNRLKEKDLSITTRSRFNEVDVLGSVRHRNIVRLLGYCTNKETTLLLYEFMPNGSLGDILHGNKEANVSIDWATRYKIAMGIAQGLSYLHHDCFPLVIHRDVKSNNILLDANMEARVADFGLAKLIGNTETNFDSMSVIAGSYGYIAPEYAYTTQVDEKSDIYSFGVVLLEIITGKRPVEPEFGIDTPTLVDWVRQKTTKTNEEGSDEVFDANMVSSTTNFSWARLEMRLVLRVALLCTSNLPIERPSMRQVLTLLSGGNSSAKIPNMAPSCLRDPILV